MWVITLPYTYILPEIRLNINGILAIYPKMSRNRHNFPLLHLALYQPDIPQNTGSMVRFCACLGVPLHIIEPCGFPIDDKRLKRVAMDYGLNAEISRHNSWEVFEEWRQEQALPLIVLTTKASLSYTDASYPENSVLLLGQESAGVPEAVHASADFRVTVPMQEGARSLNITMAAAMVTGEALRQLGGFATDRV